MQFVGSYHIQIHKGKHISFYNVFSATPDLKHITIVGEVQQQPYIIMCPIEALFNLLSTPYSYVHIRSRAVANFTPTYQRSESCYAQRKHAFIKVGLSLDVSDLLVTIYMCTNFPEI